MISFWQVLILIATGAVFLLAAFFLGAFVAYKSKSAQPYEPFIGKAPKGEVFSIADPDADEFPDEVEKNLLGRTEEFLKKFSGGGK